MISLEFTQDELNEVLYSLGDTFRSIDSSFPIEIEKAAKTFLLIYGKCPITVREHNRRTKNQILQYWKDKNK